MLQCTHNKKVYGMYTGAWYHWACLGSWICEPSLKKCKVMEINIGSLQDNVEKNNNLLNIQERYSRCNHFCIVGVKYETVFLSFKCIQEITETSQKRKLVQIYYSTCDSGKDTTDEDISPFSILSINTWTATSTSPLAIHRHCSASMEQAAGKSSRSIFIWASATDSV